MQIIYNDVEDATKSNVIYQITFEVGNHHKQYCYIGKTKRELQKRIEEHITRNHAVKQFIDNNDLEYIKVSVLYECKDHDRINLDMFETRELCRYFAKHGTMNNKRNHLINRDLKELNTYTLKDIKELFAEMSVNLGIDIPA